MLDDGGCGLCHGLVRFVLVRDAGGLFHFASLQGAAAARHLATFGEVPSRPTTLTLSFSPLRYLTSL
jgi:predicted DCC family thiol-disulfide oxidoreductase YuxK